MEAVSGLSLVTGSRRTFEGLKRDDLRRGVWLDAFQTHLRGVEAKSGTISSSASRCSRRTFEGLKHRPPPGHW